MAFLTTQHGRFILRGGQSVTLPATVSGTATFAARVEIFSEKIRLTSAALRESS
ncbi:hypothetical protein AB0C33_13995 [Nonomuraea sp. NPDC048881]|uniref:hypothetical protein n=1 Tax=Nonomuraea sp. NPDC048881 TaxID=3155030 RepID=UPI0033EDDB90